VPSVMVGCMFLPRIAWKKSSNRPIAIRTGNPI
jgi:hypothetical protein